MACCGIVCRGEYLADIVTNCKNWTPEREIDHPQRDVGGWGRVELRVGYNVMLFSFSFFLFSSFLHAAASHLAQVYYYFYFFLGGGREIDTERGRDCLSLSLCLSVSETGRHRGERDDAFDTFLT